jgi:hypothetical protein
VATAIDDEGWTAEFRIPLSQLRFSGAPLQDWGINFARDIARRNELSVWAPISPGRERRGLPLRDLRGSRPSRFRIELLPYTVTRLRRGPGDAGQPLLDRPKRQGAWRRGDLKMGVTSNLTLDLTVNPDFGQVEADPAQVNLTAFETFLPERRPFFVEGAGIFQLRDRPGRRRRGKPSPSSTPAASGGPPGRLAPGRRVGGPSPSQTRILSAGQALGEDGGGGPSGS